MGLSSLASAQAFLRDSQNSDGGWGYFPGKQSWLEPTVYAALALHGDESSKAAAGRAAKLLRAWELPDGGWRAGATVPDYHWASSVCLTFECLRGRFDQACERALDRIVDTAGMESSIAGRLAHALAGRDVEMDRSLPGWPYRDGSVSWVEPTALALTALKTVHRLHRSAESPDLMERIRLGERMLLDRRCSDGGWNYGNRRVLGVELPSYPETTGVALLGLHGRKTDLTRSLDLAASRLPVTRSPLGAAWLRIGLRAHGRPVPANDGPVSPRFSDILITALNCIASHDQLVFSWESKS